MRRRTSWTVGFFLACTSCTSSSVSHAQPPRAPAKSAPQGTTPAQEMERGEASFQAQNWADASKHFQAVVKAEPKNGRAWARLGASLHAANDFNGAAAAWQKVIDINKSPFAIYNLACALARAGQSDKALAALEESVNAGFTGASGMRKDPDWASLLTNAKFVALADKAERLAAPCLFGDEYKDFDFWVGEWDVYTPAGQKAGENIVTRASNGCLVMENWTGVFGGTGKSMNFYDPARKKWRQIWVGSVGGISEFVGEFKDSAMRFVSEPQAGSDTTSMRRLTFFHLGPNEVRQFAEKSTDGGKTFTTEYDFTYKRRTPK